MRDHEIRELVNQLRDVAIKYHGAGQLREQIARTVRAAIIQAQANDDGEPTDDERIMAIEGIHNCERCGDEGWVVGEMGIIRCACGQAGNSPVIPDGYVMVPKEPTAEMIWAAKYCFTSTPGWDVFKSAYIAMLAAADCSIPMISDRWVPVSERMPERGDYLVTDGRDFDVQSFDGEQFIPGFVWEDAITHWMPLPAAPQEVKGE
ncbi:DUF551 domain-containing protein [Raoultella planticola]|uniref:DUF551 domain-containing protein n=1 Tax=Raoultella planticola TaxID=575 RepID=UPI0038903CFE